MRTGKKLVSLETVLLKTEARLDRLLLDVDAVRERIIDALTEVQTAVSRSEHERWNKKNAPAGAGADVKDYPPDHPVEGDLGSVPL